MPLHAVSIAVGGVQASGPGEIVTMDIYIDAAFIVDDDFDLLLWAPQAGLLGRGDRIA